MTTLTSPHRRPGLHLRHGHSTTVSPRTHRRGLTGQLGLTALRLALGVEFAWAFLDKTFGLGYATPSARAWLNGGSPTRGFLTAVDAGPLQDAFHSIAGTAAADWLFMLGLAGIGTALLLGVALRVAAASGSLLLALMWLASWPPARLAGGTPTGSTNPVVDSHVISATALVVVALLAGRAVGPLGRRWADLDLVHRAPWLR